jgi:anti-anti-sigma factor
VLEDRLASLRATKSPVRLDLSELEFIDSTGIRLLITTIGDSKMKHWQLHIEPDVAPEVMRLFRLVHLDSFLLDHRSDRQAPSAAIDDTGGTEGA